jgi:hypothetical protein
MTTNPYPIFCVASILLSHSPHHNDTLDLCWEKARELYHEFLASEFNKENRSELDCINEFMRRKGYFPKCVQRSAFIWSEEDVDAQADGHNNEALVQAMSSDEKLELLECALDECGDRIIETINEAICDAISELTNP